MSSQPFAGVTVVEFGQFIAVPYCAQLLADGGAHVIKVESLEGDPVRHLAPLAPGETRHFISRNRGKHVLPLDLKHESARPVIEALLQHADVVLTNLRPGVAAEVGLDYESLHRRFPRLVVGNVTAFGHFGPDAGLAGMDYVIQARSGLMAANGRIRDGLPLAGDPPIADYMCAMMLSFGVASALFRREQTGKGGEVDVSLLMAALVLENNLILRVQGADGPTHAAVHEQLAELRREGAPYADQVAVQPQLRVSSMSSVYYRSYATKDAAIAVACVSPGLQRTFIRAIGLVDDAHHEPMNREQQARHYASLQHRAEATLASKTTAEWKEIFDRHGVPAAGVKFPIELLDDPQLLANGMLHDLPHPALGPVRMLSTPVNLDGGGFVPGHPTAAYGSETLAILGEIGFSEGAARQLLDDGITRDRPPGT
ncbi:MAG: CoA transferase [Chloroflexi bacterium]|nr:CoA transferase [Chloroflexota bacterium]